jgi:hypothetical protein
MIRAPRARHAALFGLGLVILANSRPFEGLVVSLPAILLLCGWLLSKRRPPLRSTLSRIVLPLLLVLVPSVALMALYNLRVTGDPLSMPFQLHEEQHTRVPIFIWQPLRSDAASAVAIPRGIPNDWGLEWFEMQHSLSGWAIVAVAKAKMLVDFYLGSVVMIIPWLALAWVLRNRWMLFAFVTSGVLVVALAQVWWVFPHYAAPMTCLVFVLVMQGMRQIRLWNWHGRLLGQYVIWAAPAICLLTLVLSCFGKRQADPSAGHLQRAALCAQLKNDGGEHLVIVRYGHKPAYNCWIYNEADIDASPIVWARELDEESNRRLLAYFKDRQVWLLDTDTVPYTLVSYERAVAPEEDQARVTKQQFRD